MGKSNSGSRNLNPNASKVSVLVVEDEPILRKVVRKTLERQGYQVFEAENGEQAVEIFNQNSDVLNLVLSDVRMPKMDGIELLERIRSVSEIPFIFVTGYSEIVTERTALEFGASVYLNKPFKSEQILEAVEKLTSDQAASA